MFSVEKFQ